MSLEEITASAHERFEWRDNFKDLLFRALVPDDLIFADGGKLGVSKQGMVEFAAYQAGSAVRHDLAGAVGNGDIENTHVSINLRKYQADRNDRAEKALLSLSQAPEFLTTENDLEVLLSTFTKVGPLYGVGINSAGQ